jgi:hypothetical protein
VCDATATSFPLSKHTGGDDTEPAFSGLHVYLQFMWAVGLPPLSCGVFLPLPLLQAFPLLIAGHVLLLLPSLAGLFIYSSGRIPLPPSLVLRELHHLCYVSFSLLLFIIQFFFFPGWGSVCPGGYADLAQGCLWGYCVPLSSPCGPRLPKPSGCWRLEVVREPCCFFPLT